MRLAAMFVVVSSLKNAADDVDDDEDPGEEFEGEKEGADADEKLFLAA